MKSNFNHILFFLSNTLLLSAMEYDMENNRLPSKITGGMGRAELKTDCRYSAGGGFGSAVDCKYGFDNNLGSSMNFELTNGGYGYTSLTLAGLISSNNINNQNLALFFGTLNVHNNSHLTIEKFHTVYSTYSLIIADRSSITIKLEDKKGNTGSEFGDAKRLVFSDLPYGGGGVKIIDNSSLNIEGSMLVGNVSFLLGRNSSIALSSNANDTILQNFGYFNNYGDITADKIINGGDVTQKPNGISGVKDSGVINNYGTIVSSIENYGSFFFHSYDGKAGLVIGTLDNKDNGKVYVDTKGMGYKVGNNKHRLTMGGQAMMNPTILYSNGSDQFISARETMAGEIEVTLNATAANNFEKQFDKTQKSILDALDDEYNIYSYGGRDFVRGVVNDTTKGEESSYIIAPIVMIDTLKPTFNLNLTDAISVGVIGAGFIDGLSLGAGGMGGLYVIGSINNDYNALQIQLGYGYGVSSRLNSTYFINNVSANAVMLSLMDRISFNNNFEVDLGLHSSVGLFNVNQELKLDNRSDSTSKSNFNLYSVNLDSNVGYRFKLNSYSIKPFIGFNQYYNIQSKFNENRGIKLKSDGYNNYMLYALIGLENQYKFSNKNILFAKLGYEYMIANTKKNIIYSSNGNDVLFSMLYENKISAELGGDVSVNDNIFIRISGFYKTILNKAHYLGGNLAFKYSF